MRLRASAQRVLNGIFAKFVVKLQNCFERGIVNKAKNMKNVLGFGNRFENCNTLH